jgi:CDP-diacylglycerol--glycerol-3-phosphate 3-phosphatidyltransferase
MIRKEHIPNFLTLLRVVFAAGFFGALSLYRFPETGVLWGNIAIGLFVIAAITDFFDGSLARRWNVVSNFGRIMDPFCDKVLVLGAFVYLSGGRFMVKEWFENDHLLTMASGVYTWMVVVILARELFVTSIRGVAESQGIAFGAKFSGKLKMIFQSIAIPMVLFLVVNFPLTEYAWIFWLCNGLMWSTIAITIWSGMPYLIGIRSLLHQAKPVD